jgi:hypothetical protein
MLDDEATDGDEAAIFFDVLPVVGVGEIDIESILAAAEASAAERLSIEVAEVMHLTQLADDATKVGKLDIQWGKQIREEAAFPTVEVGRLPAYHVPVEPPKTTMLLPSRLLSRPLVADAPPPTLTSVLSQRPVGRVSALWQVTETGSAQATEVVMGRLRGDEYAPTAHSSADTSGRVASKENFPGEVVGIVSRSKDTFSFSSLSEKFCVQPRRAPEPTAKELPAPSGQRRDLKAIIGLVSRLVGVFDDGGDVIQRHVPLSSNARRAKIDATLALAASRTRKSKGGAPRVGEADAKGLRTDEVRLLESIFKSYDQKGAQKMILRDFAAAMSNPKVPQRYSTTTPKVL